MWWNKLNAKQTNKDLIDDYGSFKQVLFACPWVSSAIHVAMYSSLLKCYYSLYLDITNILVVFPKIHYRKVFDITNKFH